MIGIIYKFTIIHGGIKKDGNFPFYVGQHYDVSIEKFLSKRIDNYCGSGSIWNKFITMLKKKCKRVKWRHLIKREILYSRENVSQKVLDKLEEVYIRREKAHYSFGVGGCNILWGTANEFGSGSPAKNPIVAKKISDNKKEFYKTKRGNVVKKLLSEYWSDGRINGDKNPNYGHHWTDEMKEEMSKKKRGMYKGKNNPNYGNRWTDEMKENLSLKSKKWLRERGNPMLGRKRITNGTINKTIKDGEPLPPGFRYGFMTIPKELRKPMPKFMWITNNIINKRVPKDSVIPNGWRRGTVSSLNRYKYEN